MSGFKACTKFNFCWGCAPDPWLYLRGPISKGRKGKREGRRGGMGGKGEGPAPQIFWPRTASVGKNVDADYY